MRIGTERSPEGQDTIRMLETTETPNDMIVEWEWEWRYEGDDIRTIIFELQASVSIPIPFSFVYLKRIEVYVLIYDTVLANFWEKDGRRMGVFDLSFGFDYLSRL